MDLCAAFSGWQRTDVDSKRKSTGGKKKSNWLEFSNAQEKEQIRYSLVFVGVHVTLLNDNFRIGIYFWTSRA